MTLRDLVQPRTRRYLYRVGIAVTAYLAVKGLLDGNEVALINVLVAAVLGLADGNVTEPTIEPVFDEPVEGAELVEVQRILGKA